MSWLEKFHPRVNFSKCVFDDPKVAFLGHIVNVAEIQPTEKKIKTIVNYPKHNTINDLRRFLGM